MIIKGSSGNLGDPAVSTTNSRREDRMNNSRMIHGPASRADGDEPGTPGWYRPSEGNEAWRNGRQGVAAPHSTVEAGEPTRGTP